MKKYKKMLLGISALAAIATGAIAADFGAMPVNYESSAEQYVMSRLANPRGADVQFMSDPYQIIANIGDYAGLEAWAVDLRIRSRLPSGSMSGYVPYTLIFYNGEPVAFEIDADKVVRAGEVQLVAER